MFASPSCGPNVFKQVFCLLINNLVDLCSHARIGTLAAFLMLRQTECSEAI